MSVGFDRSSCISYPKMEGLSHARVCLIEYALFGTRGPNVPGTIFVLCTRGGSTRVLECIHVRHALLNTPLEACTVHSLRLDVTIATRECSAPRRRLRRLQGVSLAAFMEGGGCVTVVAFWRLGTVCKGGGVCCCCGIFCGFNDVRAPFLLLLLVTGTRQ